METRNQGLSQTEIQGGKNHSQWNRYDGLHGGYRKLFLCSIIFGREADMELEELAEGELLREVELCGNLFDALVGLPQQKLRIIDGDGGDPFGRGLAGILLDNAGEMAGGEVRL